MEQAQVAVRADDLELDLERLAGAGKSLARHPHAVDVVGVHALEEVLVRGRDGPRLQTVDAEVLVRPALDIGVDVPFPASDLGQRAW